MLVFYSVSSWDGKLKDFNKLNVSVFNVSECSDSSELRTSVGTSFSDPQLEIHVPWSSQEASARVKFLKGTVINSYMTWFQSFNDYKVVYEENDGDTRLEMKILSNKDVDMCLY